MSMNRRNVLIGLGATAAGGGAVLGSGAFSQVTADREVAVSATGDDGALLQLDVSGDLKGSNTDTIAFELGNDVNLDATTRFNDAFSITNNGDNAVTIDITDGNGDSMVGSNPATGTDMQFENGTTSLDASSGSNPSTSFDVVFDLVGTTDSNNANIPGAITITADDSSA